MTVLVACRSAFQRRLFVRYLVFLKCDLNLGNRVGAELTLMPLSRLRMPPELFSIRSGEVTVDKGQPHDTNLPRPSQRYADRIQVQVPVHSGPSIPRWHGRHEDKPVSEYGPMPADTISMLNVALTQSIVIKADPRTRGNQHRSTGPPLHPSPESNPPSGQQSPSSGTIRFRRQDHFSTWRKLLDFAGGMGFDLRASDGNLSLKRYLAPVVVGLNHLPNPIIVKLPASKPTPWFHRVRKLGALRAGLEHESLVTPEPDATNLCWLGAFVCNHNHNHRPPRPRPLLMVLWYRISEVDWETRSRGCVST